MFTFDVENLKRVSPKHFANEKIRAYTDLGQFNWGLFWDHFYQ